MCIIIERIMARTARRAVSWRTAFESMPRGCTRAALAGKRGPKRSAIRTGSRPIRRSAPGAIAFRAAVAEHVGMNADEQPRPPLPPFTRESALAKVQAAEDAWNTRDPEKVAAAYTPDTQWRNRDEHVQGRAEVVAFLTRKWERELDYRLRKNLWAFEGDRIAVRFQYEWHDASGQWFRSYGNELWEFAEDGRMRRREASINDAPITESERRVTPGEGEIPVW